MPTTDPRHLALARRWLAKARTDLAVATVVLEQGPDMDAWAACFHAQQSAEKALKAVLVARGVDPPYIHDLRALAAVMPDDLMLGLSPEQVGVLSTFATGPRYVFGAGIDDDPSWVRAEEATVIAGEIFRAVSAYLAVSG